MEEKKTLKIKKPYILIFTLAIVFAILGFMDLKVWAMESLTQGPAIEEQYIHLNYYTYDYVDKQYIRLEWNADRPSQRIALYYGDFKDDIREPNNTDNIIENTGKGYRLCVLRDDESNWQYWYGSSIKTIYDKNQSVISSNEYESFYINYLYHYETVPKSTADFMEVGSIAPSSREVISLELDTNIPIFTDWECLRQYLETGLYDVSGTLIDYSRLQTDDTIGIIEKPLMNIIINEILEENDIIEALPQKKLEVYNYLVWNNTENFDLQVEIAPFVNVNKGMFDKTFWKQIDGEWETFQILLGGTTTMTQRSDMYYLKEINSKYIDFLNTVEKEYGGLNKKCDLFFGYRFRYVDISTMRAGKWVYILPGSNGYASYVEYLDGSMSSVEKLDGVSVETENVGDINTVKDNIDLENEFLEKYETVDFDVSEATNWLQSVATFIKGTPAFVGSVLSFLPQPILYGIYICIFLGVIAGGYAIIKALI